MNKRDKALNEAIKHCSNPDFNSGHTMTDTLTCLNREFGFRMAWDLACNWQYEQDKNQIKKLENSLSMFIEYFKAISNGEYSQQRPAPLRDYEHYILQEANKVLKENK